MTIIYDYEGILSTEKNAGLINPYDITVGSADKLLDKGANGIVQAITETQTPGESWIDTLTKLIPALTLTTQQVQLMQLNVERAKKGLPPVDIASYSGIGVNVGLSGDTKNLLIYGGIALVAVFFLTRGR